MKGKDLIASFELEINKIDDAAEKPITDDSLYWINQAIVRFTKDRFNGNAPKRTSYEQNEKRTRDLVNLLREAKLEYTESSEHRDYVEYVYTYPDGMMFMLNEDVVICNNEGENETDTCVFECTADSFMYRINNKLTDFHYRFKRARPLRIRTSDGCKLLTDGNYKIKEYTVGYLKVPTEITSENPDQDYTDFEDYIWLEIIKIAAQMYIENTSDSRYKTIMNEVLTQE